MTAALRGNGSRVTAYCWASARDGRCPREFDRTRRPRTASPPPYHKRRLLVEALKRSGQSQTRAARLLKISREQLRTRMKRYGLLAQKT